MLLIALKVELQEMSSNGNRKKLRSGFKKFIDFGGFESLIHADS